MAKQVSDVIVDARYLILAGIGLVTAGYVLLRSAIELEFDFGTLANVAVSAAVSLLEPTLGTQRAHCHPPRHALEQPRGLVAARGRILVACAVTVAICRALKRKGVIRRDEMRYIGCK